MSLFDETLEAMKNDPGCADYLRHREDSARDRETDRFISHLMDIAAMAEGSEEIGGLFGRMWEHYEQTKEAYDRAARRERYAPSMMDIYLRLQNLFDPRRTRTCSGFSRHSRRRRSCSATAGWYKLTKKRRKPLFLTSMLSALKRRQASPLLLCTIEYNILLAIIEIKLCEKLLI